jgi:hypothetical protein
MVVGVCYFSPPSKEFLSSAIPHIKAIVNLVSEPESGDGNKNGP